MQHIIFKKTLARTAECKMKEADLEVMKATVNKVDGNLIPRYDTLRWVPTRFRGVLPLAVMKRYKCVVVGAAPGMLTVALAQGQEKFVLELLTELTGCTIFPVLIPPGRMRLLIERMERAECDKSNMFSKKLLLHPLQIHSIVMFTAARWQQHR